MTDVCSPLCPFRGCPTCPNQGTDDHTEVDGQLTIYDALKDTP